MFCGPLTMGLSWHGALLALTVIAMPSRARCCVVTWCYAGDGEDSSAVREQQISAQHIPVSGGALLRYLAIVPLSVIPVPSGVMHLLRRLVMDL